ncbi:MAG: hypothetical protein KatS3mg110_4102 [Pirellulaceae bacterium]|nr:MAG: hypothetical protein KatS3mg110_4102 [Pirellulaceae bacterium]
MLLRCFAGCRTHDVLQVLGLSWRDLWPDENRKRLSRLPRADGSRSGGLTFPTERDAIQWLSRKFGRPVKRWTYRDAAGEVVGAVVRWNCPDGKIIRPIARCSTGWRLTAMPPPRPLFRLPELLAAPADRPIFLVEGEPAADAARAMRAFGFNFGRRRPGGAVNRLAATGRTARCRSPRQRYCRAPLCP